MILVSDVTERLWALGRSLRPSALQMLLWYIQKGKEWSAMQSVWKCWEGVVTLRSNTSRATLSYIAQCARAWGSRDLLMNVWICIHLSPRLQAQLSSIIVLRHYSQGLPGSHLSHRHWHDYAKNEMGHRTWLECVSCVCLHVCIEVWWSERAESSWKCTNINPCHSES